MTRKAKLYMSPLRQFSVNVQDEISKKNPLKSVFKGLNPPMNPFEEPRPFAKIFTSMLGRGAGRGGEDVSVGQKASNHAHVKNKQFRRPGAKHEKKLPPETIFLCVFVLFCVLNQIWGQFFDQIFG